MSQDSDSSSDQPRSHQTIGIDFGSFARGLMSGQPEQLHRVVFDQLFPQPGGPRTGRGGAR